MTTYIVFSGSQARLLLENASKNTRLAGEGCMLLDFLAAPADFIFVKHPDAICGDTPDSGVFVNDTNINNANACAALVKLVNVAARISTGLQAPAMDADALDVLRARGEGVVPYWHTNKQSAGNALVTTDSELLMFVGSGDLLL
ncbi:hypothetical protein EVAR_49650_1 [Eumeta japonica]|uniref:Uncharacterized protein n=1 Tax=Eumeta variegata TaxID=151549 RepID=A0A4C1YCK3_EUMVA|nr:hypothetical protein EVAR_49650_1 [Eumeta japonica]